MHIQEAARQGSLQGDIEVAKEKTSSAHEVHSILIFQIRPSCLFQYLFRKMPWDTRNTGKGCI